MNVSDISQVKTSLGIVHGTDESLLFKALDLTRKKSSQHVTKSVRVFGPWSQENHKAHSYGCTDQDGLSDNDEYDANEEHYVNTNQQVPDVDEITHGTPADPSEITYGWTMTRNPRARSPHYSREDGWDEDGMWDESPPSDLKRYWNSEQAEVPDEFDEENAVRLYEEFQDCQTSESVKFYESPDLKPANISLITNEVYLAEKSVSPVVSPKDTSAFVQDKDWPVANEGVFDIASSDVTLKPIPKEGGLQCLEAVPDGIGHTSHTSEAARVPEGQRNEIVDAARVPNVGQGPKAPGQTDFINVTGKRDPFEPSQTSNEPVQREYNRAHCFEEDVTKELAPCSPMIIISDDDSQSDDLWSSLQIVDPGVESESDGCTLNEGATDPSQESVESQLELSPTSGHFRRVNRTEPKVDCVDGESCKRATGRGTGCEHQTSLKLHSTDLESREMPRLQSNSQVEMGGIDVDRHTPDWLEYIDEAFDEYNRCAEEESRPLFSQSCVVGETTLGAHDKQDVPTLEVVPFPQLSHCGGPPRSIETQGDDIGSFANEILPSPPKLVSNREDENEFYKGEDTLQSCEGGVTESSVPTLERCNGRVKPSDKLETTGVGESQRPRCAQTSDAFAQTDVSGSVGLINSLNPVGNTAEKRSPQSRKQKRSLLALNLEVPRKRPRTVELSGGLELNFAADFVGFANYEGSGQSVSPLEGRREREEVVEYVEGRSIVTEDSEREEVVEYVEGRSIVTKDSEPDPLQNPRFDGDPWKDGSVGRKTTEPQGKRASAFDWYQPLSCVETQLEDTGADTGAVAATGTDTPRHLRLRLGLSKKTKPKYNLHPLP